MPYAISDRVSLISLSPCDYAALIPTKENP
jgi:hypothetical protein